MCNLSRVVMIHQNLYRDYHCFIHNDNWYITMLKFGRMQRVRPLFWSVHQVPGLKICGVHFSSIMNSKWLRMAASVQTWNIFVTQRLKWIKYVKCKKYVNTTFITSHSHLWSPNLYLPPPPTAWPIGNGREEFKNMEATGVLRRSGSKWSSPLHTIPKSHGISRPCGDYHKLNNATTPDRYPIPYIQDISANLTGCTFFF